MRSWTSSTSCRWSTRARPSSLPGWGGFPDESTAHDRAVLRAATAFATEHGLVVTTALLGAVTVEEIVA